MGSTISVFAVCGGGTNSLEEEEITSGTQNDTGQLTGTNTKEEPEELPDENWDALFPSNVSFFLHPMTWKKRNSKVTEFQNYSLTYVTEDQTSLFRLCAASVVTDLIRHIDTGEVGDVGQLQKALEAKDGTNDLILASYGDTTAPRLFDTRAITTYPPSWNMALNQLIGNTIWVWINFRRDLDLHCTVWASAAQSLLDGFNAYMTVRLEKEINKKTHPSVSDVCPPLKLYRMAVANYKEQLKDDDELCRKVLLNLCYAYCFVYGRP